ncbi:MAG: FecR family protein [Alphaproteobacteria bacterium]|nr:FecR family protein [Alphaproteobacteria bacterium]MBU2271678.1 FecR family protein [Alphaproteobacteria bacterium]MBU2417806.1 FecR family protein [Alphaproteobacteria bacterium]
MTPATPTRSIDADAAVWLARLHGAEEEAVRPALDAWLAADPAHAEAFERANETWAILPRAARYGQEELYPPPPVARRRMLYPAAMAACLAVVVSFGALWWSLADAGAYATAAGEQKVATLADGSRIALNTDTQVDVRFNAERRQIELDRGEAMFEVAHDADRPFVVVAGDTRVVALGTVFTVRRTRDDVVVTLIKGKVAVSHDRPRTGGAVEAPLVLRPGEKLTEPLDGPRRIEPGSIEAATAWRRGQTVFSETPLGEAVTELNRYGGPVIVVDDPRVAALPVSGVFATNAPDFAEAAATLHGLRIEKEDDALHIKR